MALRSDLLPALAAFEAAARHQNFAHAAEELHLTASAVSHHVRKLEARLEVSLFQRHARGVSLTTEGRQLADAAGSAMADMEGVLRSLRAAGAEHDRIRITTLHSLAYTWLLPRMPGFVAAHPQLCLSVDTEIALTRFDEGGPDLGIRHGPGHWPGLTAHHLMDDYLFPVASPNLPGVSELGEAAHVARLPLISDHARQGWHDWFRAAEVHGVKLNERYSFSDTTDALQAAVYGLGAALAREQVAVPYLRSGHLVRLPGPSVKARWGYYAVYPAHRRLRASARLFLDWLLAVEKD
ncbi:MULTISPECIES: LysR substrate-binding domain-containing protein [unclassified Lysobacter]|uniref:LysR substrate-binding domain-containing protein n=1 Tax=unclassified Lysobacter TaxID=2635362 RepID=UPI0006F4B2E6|nr:MULTISPECIES: LysR substrate-binding domain-containing protein [unclassified Lysobacter]KQZ66191.1 LysR family transcriptional regulator [Lysobacter sp. Root559]KRA72818.1 LysR family transcriptional regulator [Lysobacter sp. Root667]KRC32219.1 LysR family transcriptional regulator [Lysobacter sp. Root76]KRD67681.1 LysR family transcriptional regulator [Lysobacter sp. Root96]